MRVPPTRVLQDDVSIVKNLLWQVWAPHTRSQEQEQRSRRRTRHVDAARGSVWVVASSARRVGGCRLSATCPIKSSETRVPRRALSTACVSALAVARGGATRCAPECGELDVGARGRRCVGSTTGELWGALPSACFFTLRTTVASG